MFFTAKNDLDQCSATHHNNIGSHSLANHNNIGILRLFHWSGIFLKFSNMVGNVIGDIRVNVVIDISGPIERGGMKEVHEYLIRMKSIRIHCTLCSDIDVISTRSDYTRRIHG